MSAPRSPAAARLAVVALAALCLCAGFLLGRLLPDAPRSTSYLEQLTRALELRPEQVARAEAVLAAEDREIDALVQRGFDGVADEVTARRERTGQELLAVLDEAQRRRYDELLAAEGVR
ncbi:MAG: hypothetical protein FJ296_00970 [Planctomycetes bacterium]|nr:hypothetical protein [Planctomycetota bacterium]